jgi:hypothetical protein
MIELSIMSQIYQKSRTVFWGLTFCSYDSDKYGNQTSTNRKSRM